MKDEKDKKVKEYVKKGYAKIAKEDSSCCAPAGTCCSGNTKAEDIGKNIGYTEEEMKSVPEGANLGLGCGNPTALASLKEGEIVLDLGSGAGFDCFLAAKEVGERGRVIGIDMTQEMVEKARANAKKENYQNVEFRLGEIEKLPVGDDSVDVIISNCVVNLSLDKRSVFKEAFRVLKPGGRLMISDIVLTKELPQNIKTSVEAYVGCIAGAELKTNYLNQIKEAGFENIEVVGETPFSIELMTNDPIAQVIIGDLKISKEEASEIVDTVLSIKVSGIKPQTKSKLVLYT